MKKELTLILNFIVVLVFSGIAQTSNIQIATFFPSTESFTKADVFSFNVSNFSEQPKEGKLEITIVVNTSHKSILTVTKEHVRIEKGINVYSAMDFSETWYLNDVSRAFQSTGILPSGDYDICVLLTLVNGETGQLKECSRLFKKEDFFIHLLTPDDRAEIETLNPLLQWYCSTSDPLVKYHLMLAPLGKFTRAEDALADNLKLLEIDLYPMQYLYPPQALPLKFGEYYAWQVIALKDNSVLGFSEAWIFKPIEKSSVDDQEKDCYRLINKNFNNGNYLYGDVMKFAYKNVTRESVLNYSVRDLTTGALIDNPPTLKLQPGLNKIDLELKQLNGIRKGHQYMVQIRNKENETYKLTFNPYEKETMRE